MSTITLPERCDKAAVEALLKELRAAQGAPRIEIDGYAVTQAGLAVLQLLVSARRSSSSVAITPSPALMDAAQLTGLTVELFEEVTP